MSVLFNVKVMRTGLLLLLLGLLSACSQAPKKAAAPIKPSVQQSQTPPLASDLSAKDEYEFALDLARLELKRQRYARAEGLLQKLRKIDRQDVRVYRSLAQVYEAQKKSQMALIAWKQVNKSADKTIRDEAELARLALMHEEFVLAEQIYQAWLKSDSELQQVSAFNNLGFSAVLQKRYPQAKQYFEQALALDPLNTKALNNLKLVNTLIE